MNTVNDLLKNVQALVDCGCGDLKIMPAVPTLDGIEILSDQMITLCTPPVTLNEGDIGVICLIEPIPEQWFVPAGFNRGTNNET